MLVVTIPFFRRKSHGQTQGTLSHNNINIYIEMGIYLLMDGRYRKKLITPTCSYVKNGVAYSFKHHYNDLPIGYIHNILPEGCNKPSVQGLGSIATSGKPHVGEEACTRLTLVKSSWLNW